MGTTGKIFYSSFNTSLNPEISQCYLSAVTTGTVTLSGGYVEIGDYLTTAALIYSQTNGLVPFANCCTITFTIKPKYSMPSSTQQLLTIADSASFNAVWMWQFNSSISIRSSDPAGTIGVDLTVAHAFSSGVDNYIHLKINENSESCLWIDGELKGRQSATNLIRSSKHTKLCLGHFNTTVLSTGQGFYIKDLTVYDKAYTHAELVGPCKCTIWHQVMDGNGTVDVGAKMRFDIVPGAEVSATNYALAKTSVTATADTATGMMTAALVPSSKLDPETQWRVRVYDSNGRRVLDENVTVPEQPSAELNDLFDN